MKCERISSSAVDFSIQCLLTCLSKTSSAIHLPDLILISDMASVVAEHFIKKAAFIIRKSADGSSRLLVIIDVVFHRFYCLANKACVSSVVNVLSDHRGCFCEKLFLLTGPKNGRNQKLSNFFSIVSGSVLFDNTVVEI